MFNKSSSLYSVLGYCITGCIAFADTLELKNNTRIVAAVWLFAEMLPTESEILLIKVNNNGNLSLMFSKYALDEGNKVPDACAACSFLASIPFTAIWWVGRRQVTITRRPDALHHGLLTWTILMSVLMLCLFLGLGPQSLLLQQEKGKGTTSRTAFSKINYHISFVPFCSSDLRVRN